MPDARRPGRAAAPPRPRPAASRPPANSSQASWRLSGPLPAISTRSPGQTRCARTNVCSAPVVITPGSVQPGRGTGRSCAPGASTSRRGRNVTARPPTSAAISSAAKPPQTVASVSMRAPAAMARSRNAMPRRNCGSGAAVGMAVGERLGVLPAGGAALVQHHDRCTCLRGGDRGRQPGRPRADHQHVAHLVLGLRAVGFVAERRQRQSRLAGDRHAVGHLGHAGALADAAIHRHHAVETGAHAAMQAARRAGGGAAVGDDAGGGQGGGDGLAFERGDRMSRRTGR